MTTTHRVTFTLPNDPFRHVTDVQAVSLPDAISQMFAKYPSAALVAVRRLGV